MGSHKPGDVGLTLNLRDVPASRLDFLATGFQIKTESGFFVMLFGATSSFDESAKHFNQALEMRMPAKYAREWLVNMIRNRPPQFGNEPFIDTLVGQLTDEDKRFALSYKCSTALPLDLGRDYRTFQAIGAFVSLADIVGNIEFLKIPPAAFAMQSIKREGNEARSILNVEISARLLYAFLLRTREMIPE
jgi:hypothetical protein